MNGLVDWERDLRDTAHTFCRAALVHPNVVPSLVTRSLSGPLALATPGNAPTTGRAPGLVQQRPASIGAAPCTPPGCHRIPLLALLHELQERIDNPNETDDLLRLGLHRLPVTEFPRCRCLAAILAAYDGAANSTKDSTSPSPDFAANSSFPTHPRWFP